MTIQPTTEIAGRLLAVDNYPLISIYMPTHRAGPDIWQDPIRFKNLLNSAEHDLETAGVPQSTINSLLKPLVTLRDDRTFWQYQSHGLAIFRSATSIQEFRLPTDVPELCVVGSRFHVKPLLMSLSGDQSFYVLALSQNAVRLFHGSAYGLQEVQDASLPQGLEVNEERSERTMESHSTGRGTRVQHATEIDRKSRLGDYCRRIDKVLCSHVGETDVVILAAVDYLAAIYRDVSSSRALSGTVISGNPDICSADRLFEKAMPIARGHFDERRAEAERRYLQNVHTGKVLNDPEEAIRAAKQGRIETLFVPIGLQIWGSITGEGEVHLSEERSQDDEDLLNVVLIDTWKSGGQVFAVRPEEMPGGSTVAAVVRY